MDKIRSHQFEAMGHGKPLFVVIYRGIASLLWVSWVVPKRISQPSAVMLTPDKQAPG